MNPPTGRRAELADPRVPVPAPTAADPGGSGRAAVVRRWIARVGRPVVAVALVGAVTWAAVRQWDAVRGTVTAIEVPHLVLALLLAMAGMLANVMAFNAVLGALGTRVHPVEAGRCYLVGQIGKYLPGSVWAFVLQMELAKRAGVPRVNGFTATVVTLALSIASALVIGLIGLRHLFEVGGAAPWLVLGLLPVVVVCALPPVLTRLVDLALRLMRRRPLPRPLGWGHVGAVLGWTSLAWVLFGTHLWMLTTSEAASGAGGWVQSLGVFALAMTAGSLALVAPSGIGVREAIVVAALAPVVPVGVALGLALASRLVF
ncbi:MAG TPA: lysylphosphatidylglycerol synthase domain-containing protein, partial [Pseudonocardia sp.]|nr:lysylphosphatidylglycerol synthase domain-containing protein [Pseudonocardia sp.]